ncbi:MAG: hypothetical protein OXC69_08240 [Candidatus Tectomicrobia bacterium]|nr:hypothetical protein [Candidatus Tectomicrobia bacterium]
MPNFVDVVGYQLEKVHTGVIAWLLGGQGSPLPLAEQEAVIEEIAPGILQKEQLTAVTARREYSFGRQLRIDLVLKITRKNQTEDHILIECKTDSDVNMEQLIRQRKTFAQKKGAIPFSSIVLAVGAGQFTLKHQLHKIQQLGFRAINLSEALRIFSGLSIAGKHHAYDDWIASLLAERARCDAIAQELSMSDSPRDRRLREAGYRLGFPVYYNFYDSLRTALEGGPFQEWAIYSGGNNPVMNWYSEEGWIKSGSKESAIQLFWEFNWDTLCIKAGIGNPKKENKEQIAARWQYWTDVRHSLVKICATCSTLVGKEDDGQEGINFQNPRRSVTAYKWQFNYCNEAPHIIADCTKKIIECVHPKLSQLHQKKLP